MFIAIKCVKCQQSFDADSSRGQSTAECPQCGAINPIPGLPPPPPPKPALQYDAPTLAGAMQCPSCKSKVSKGDILCTHCGYNFATRQKVNGTSWFSTHKSLLGLLGAAAVVLLAAASYLFGPISTPPPPPVYAPSEPEASKPALPGGEPTAGRETSATTTTVAALPVPPPPPPSPSAEELAAQQAEKERAAREAELAAFAARKFEAEQEFRLQLDLREPLFTANELVELRRKNGVVHKGTFSGLSGTGTNRVVLLATPAGEIGVPVADLDPATRRRTDPEYREAFIRHVMNTRLPDPPAKE